MLPSSRSSIDRWELLDLVKATRAYIGVKDREIAVLTAHLSVLPKGPIETRSRQLSYMKVTDILSRACCMEPKRFRLGELRLEECGLVLRRLSANGRRFPMRDAKGLVVDAYGIDLAPLIARVPELEDMRLRLREEARLQKDRRTRLSCRLSELKRRAMGMGDEAVCRVLAKVAELRNRLRRNSISVEEQADLERLMDAEETRLTALDTAASTKLTPLPVHDPAPELHSTEITEADATAAAGACASVKTAGDDGRFDRHRESPRKDFIESPRFDLAGVNASWKGTRQLQTYYPAPPRTEHEAGVRLQEFSGFMGLGQSVVAWLIATLGWKNAVTLVDDLACRIMKGSVEHPAAYVRSVLRSYRSGNAIAGGRICSTVGPSTTNRRSMAGV